MIGIMTKLAFTVMAALLSLTAPARAAEVAAEIGGEDPAQACTASPLLVGACFTVHGRLTACTGIPNATIWIVGTKRILGVVDATGKPGGDRLLPGRLDTAMFTATPCSKAAFGDFTVCPLTAERPGVMQRVCVAGAAKLVLRDR